MKIFYEENHRNTFLLNGGTFPHPQDGSTTEAAIQHSIEMIANPVRTGTLASRICRYGFNTSIPYSIAEHSIIAAHHAFLNSEDEVAVAMIFHDLHECYSGFCDVFGGHKKHCPYIKEREEDLDRLIEIAYLLPDRLLEHERIVHYDYTMLWTEIRQFFPECYESAISGEFEHYSEFYEPFKVSIHPVGVSNEVARYFIPIISNFLKNPMDLNEVKSSVKSFSDQLTKDV